MTSGRRWPVLPLMLVTLMLTGLAPLPDSPSGVEVDTVVQGVTPLGQATSVNIGSWPNGASERVEISVQDGHAIQSMDVTIEPGVLPQSTALVWDSPQEFRSNTIYDGMNVNDTALAVLPQGWTYDFEGTNSWTLGSNWFLGKDTTSSRPTTSTVPSGNYTLYSHDGDYGYMTSTFWATSPVMNCASCSGNWNLEYMKQLGVESSTWDHAYASVKNTQGNWVNVWSNSGTINDGTFSKQTIDISTYVANNANFQVRFGIGTADSSVHYSGWNIDDVSVLPAASGISSGEGNWTSEPFGPERMGRGELTSYGLLHMDATVTGDALFEWQLLDAVTMQPVQGFERMTSTHIDLGMVNQHDHPLVRLKLHMRLGSTGGEVTVRSISHNGHLSHTFESDPTASGWDIQSGGHANGAISSNGLVFSDTYRMRGGFSMIETQMAVTGTASMHVSVDGGLDWIPLDMNGRLNLSAPAHMAQFRMSAVSSSSYSWSNFEVELVRNAPTQSVAIDVGLDGVNEWSIVDSGIQTLGLQTRLSDGSSWQLLSTTPSSTGVVEFLLPTSGVDDLTFSVASPNTPLSNPFMAMAVNGQDILNRGLPTLGDMQVLTLSSTELQSLNNALTSTTANTGGDLPMATVQVRIGSSLASADLLIGGVFSPFDPQLTIGLTGIHPVVVSLNDALTDTIAVGGLRTVSLPIRMSTTGAVQVTIDNMVDAASVRPVTQTLENATDTLVPSNDWIEVSSTFDFSSLGVTNALTHSSQSGWDVMLMLSGEERAASITCSMASLPLSGSGLAGCTSTGLGLLWNGETDEGHLQVVGSGLFLEVQHRFQFPDGWDDEPAVQLSVTLVSNSGPMLPLTTTLGLGSTLGVENDLVVDSWSVLHANGVRTSQEYPYLTSGSLVNIEVVLGFENASEGTPRSGQALVRLLVDGNEYASTSIYDNGVILFPYNIPTGRTSLDLAVEVLPLRGQNVQYAVEDELTFLFDNTVPSLVGMDVERFDNRDASPVTTLDFSIADRPHLPVHAYVHLWRSWLDDSNLDGLMDEDEVLTLPLIHPADMNDVVGSYSLVLDTSEVQSSDHFIGWLEVADSAGHIMPLSGDFGEPLFHVQINTNGAPSLGATPMVWENGTLPWLHPGETHTISIPVWEQNGIYDLAEIELALASNTPSPSLITWNQSLGTCTSSNVYLTVNSCGLRALDSADLFSRNGYFDASFSFEWGYDPDVSLIRTPHIGLLDQSGQSNQYLLTDLSWRFSGEVVVDADSVQTIVSGEGLNDAGYWVQPRTAVDIAGDLVWSRTQRLVMTPLSLTFEAGMQETTVGTTNGTFRVPMLSPLLEDTYGLTVELFDEPLGAVYRGDGSPLVWLIVDQEAPRVVDVDSPMSSTLLTEDLWTDLVFELRLFEEAQLDVESLRLHWSLNQAGLGLNSYMYDNGSLPLSIVGERTSGRSIPVRASFDLNEKMLPAFRTERVELRIWVSGQDRAGYDIDAVFNDVDAPLRVWALEQRIPSYVLSEVELRTSSSFRQGDAVTVGMTISNEGLADGEANIVLELVETTGARTRLDARVMSVQSGENSLYQYVWIPDRSGTMWLEVSVIGGPNSQSPTVLVDEPRSSGVLGSVSSINGSLLAIFGFLVVGLVTFIAVGMRRKGEPTVPKQPPSLAKASSANMRPTSAPVGPYDSTQTPDVSPGENPYN